MADLAGLMVPRADDGTTNEPLSTQNIPHHMAIAAFTGIAWYNVIELNVSIYIKFNRIWSLRNLDVLLLFVLAPGMMALVGRRGDHPWVAYAWLLTGSDTTSSPAATGSQWCSNTSLVRCPLAPIERLRLIRPAMWKSG